jgi:hypothetical protein
MVQTLQHKTPAQRSGIQAASAGSHHPFAGQANYELTFKPTNQVGLVNVMDSG